MGRRWPALEVAVADDDQAARIQAIADDFSPTAIEETTGGLRFFFSTSTDRDHAAVALEPRFRVSPIDVPDDDWARRSQETLTPISVGRIVVTPPWHVAPGTNGPPTADQEPTPTAHRPPITIVILPSMGFGTGHHATTRLCLAALQAVELIGASVLDAGTGSGVLAMAAVRLGAARALGIDDDPDAIQSAVENLALNPDIPPGRLTFAVGDLTTLQLPPADVVIANLTGGLLVRAAERLQQAVKRGGVLVMSGLQAGERDDVWRAFAGFELVAEAEEDGWSTITARKGSNS